MFSSKAEIFEGALPLDAFADNAAHLRAEIDWLRRLIRSEISRTDGRVGAAIVDEFAGLYVSQDQIDRYLAEPSSDRDRDTARPHAEELRSMRAALDRRVQMSEAAGVDLRLALLARTFELNDLVRTALLCCVAAELDVGMSRLFAYLQDDATKKRPTFGLLARLTMQRAADPVGARELFAPSSPLLRHRLLEPLTDTLEAPFTATEARVATGLIDFLVGVDQLPPVLAEAVDLIVATDNLEGLAYQRHHRAIVEELLRCRRAKGTLPFCYVGGPAGAGRGLIVKALGAAIGKNILRVRVAKLPTTSVGVENVGHLLARDARLRNSLVLLEGADEAADEGDREKARGGVLVAALHALNGCEVVATGTAAPAELRRRLRVRPLAFELGYPSPGEAGEIWRHLLPPHIAADIPMLAGKFRFTPGQIAQAIDVAMMAAPRDTTGRPDISSADLHARCRDEAESGLHLLCQKIVPRHCWADIVLPADTQAQLQEICRWAKHRSQVYEDWGFGARRGPGAGLTILFSGGSGTGKTMSAEIIADELQLDLFRVDLSRIVSKYIGETEKNLSRIFAQNSSNNCILFFDEADALFGKRTEVKDAHDRYANIEINYLLAEMELYQGVIIISTNMKGNIDQAFIRRFSHVVEYPMPNERLREAIWRKSFPSRTPLAADVDFVFLAQKFNLSGGNIKNIALSSAFLASADGGEVITMHHVILATKREYQKLGRVCSRSDFGQHYALVREDDAP